MVEAMENRVEEGNAKRPVSNLEWQDKLLQTKKSFGPSPDEHKAKGTKEQPFIISLHYCFCEVSSPVL